MVRAGRDFVVYDAKTGEDITRSVLTQIIVEEEGKGRAMLPTSFLRQLIGFYGDSLQTLVPRYLEQTMSNFARQQQQMRSAMQQTMGSFLPFSMEEVGRQNMAMMERAMSLFSPFYRPEPTPGELPGTARAAGRGGDPAPGGRAAAEGARAGARRAAGPPENRAILSRRRSPIARQFTSIMCALDGKLLLVGRVRALECLSKPARLSRMAFVFEHRSGAGLQPVSSGAQKIGARRPA